MSTSVNAPTNTKIKEQDINSKLQLYGIYEGTFPLLPCPGAMSRHHNTSPNGLYSELSC